MLHFIKFPQTAHFCGVAYYVWKSSTISYQSLHHTSTGVGSTICYQSLHALAVNQSQSNIFDHLCYVHRHSMKEASFDMNRIIVEYILESSGFRSMRSDERICSSKDESKRCLILSALSIRKLQNIERSAGSA